MKYFIVRLKKQLQGNLGHRVKWRVHFLTNDPCAAISEK